MIVSVLCPVRAVLARQEVARDPILIPIISESLGLTDGDGDPTGRYQYQSYYLYNAHIFSRTRSIISGSGPSDLFAQTVTAQTVYSRNEPLGDLGTRVKSNRGQK